MTDYARDPNNLRAERIHDELVLQPLLRQIDAEIATLARLADVPAIFIERPEDWADFAFPARFIAGIEPPEIEDLQLGPDTIWQIPNEPVTIHFGPTEINYELLELMFGESVRIELCHQVIPAKGTE